MKTALLWGGAVLVVLVALAVAYWFATGGVPASGAPGWLTSATIAHRGQWTDGPERPENSLAAFEEAASNGYAIELDVQLSSDRHVMVFHDSDLERMTGEKGAVGDKTYAELSELKLLGGDQTIPSLARVLGQIKGRVPVLIEIKNAGAVGDLERAVAGQLRAYDGEVAVMSFNPLSVEAVADAAPDIPRGQLSGTFEGEDLAFYKLFLLRNMLLNFKSKPHFIAYELVDLPRWDTKLQQRRGRPLLGWTAENPQQREDAKAFCDNVICNPGALP